MKKIILIAVMLIIGSVLGAFAAGGLTFNTTIPGATDSTLGANEILEKQKAAITEIRTKMNTWAVYTGYSTGRAGR